MVNLKDGARRMGVRNYNFVYSDNNWSNSIQIKKNNSIFVYRRECLLYHLSIEKLLDFR